MLILASQSPRRREILANAGICFDVRSVSVTERREPGESPLDYVLRLARSKADAVAMRAGEVVLGADTVVVLDDKVLEKPRNAADAQGMLQALSGREHRVLTGICLRHASGRITDSAETSVRFAPLSQQEIEEYVRSGEGLDKAGAYGIQGIASKFVERIEGCYFNVVGLPIAVVYRVLKEITGQISVPG